MAKTHLRVQLKRVKMQLKTEINAISEFVTYTAEPILMNFCTDRWDRRDGNRLLLP